MSYWCRVLSAAALLLTSACVPAAPAAPPTPAGPPLSKPTTAPAPPPTQPQGKPTTGAAGAASSASPVASSSAEWDRVLAEARREGQVNVAGAPGNLNRQAMNGFEQKYPDIKLEYSGFNARDFQVKFATERSAGQYLWDIDINGPTNFDIEAKKSGDLAPMRSALLLPEVNDEKVWFGGFQGAFLDSEKQYVFAYQAEITPQVYVNRDLIPEAELSTIQGLLDPKWKGKIAMGDPRVDGAGNGRIASWLGQLGEEFVRSLLQQDVAVTQDGRQLTAWIVRGQYPIVIGLGGTDLLEFTKEGLGLNVQPLGGTSPEAWRMSSGFGVVRMIERAPHPNAAKVFLNWLLSKEGQTAWVDVAGRSSRRLDVRQIEGMSPREGLNYFDIDREERLPFREKAKVIAQQILK